MSSILSLQLTIPLSHAAHAIAMQFAAEQATPDKGQRVYLNTLAVYAVHTYLNWLEVVTDLEQGDSWQPGLRAVLEVADLVVPGLGKIECCPVLPGESRVVIPAAIAGDRLGYVAVQFDERLEAATLLGFVRDIDSSIIDSDDSDFAVAEFTQLGLDGLLDVLYPEAAIVNLREWLEQTFRQLDWHPPEHLVPPRFQEAKAGSRGIRGGTSEPADGSSHLKRVSRAKSFALGTSSTETVVLVVQVISQTNEDNTLNVRIRLYPHESCEHLPRELKVKVSDENGKAYLEAQPRDSDIWLQLELLDCHPSERFNVKITLDEITVTEEFIV